MKLTDLEPRWWAFEENGPRVGLTFDCPCCRNIRLAICFHHRGHEVIEDKYILCHPAHPDHIWNLENAEDFATLTVTPSIDASKVGHWHGFVTNGEIR